MRIPRTILVALAVVLLAAAVLSFDALRGLALAVSIPKALAWLLPIAVDAGAAVSCAVWLGGRAGDDAAQYAGRMTWALLAVTVAGNAGQLGMHAHDITPPWWVAVLVGTIPPAVVGCSVHLVVLLVRRTDTPRTETGEPSTGPAEVHHPTAADEPPALAGPVPNPVPVRAPDQPTADPDRTDQPTGPDRTGADRTDDQLLVDLADLADRTGGRPTGRAVRAELGVGADRAKRLLEQFDQTGPRRTA